MVFLDNLLRFTGRDSLVYKDKTYSYDDLLAKIKCQEKYLAKNNVRPGEVVVLLSDYNFQSVALFFALLNNRNIIIPVASGVPAEINERIREGQADIIIDFGSGAAKIEKCSELAEKHELIQQLVKSSAAGLILFSSGSTGKPKVMIHNLSNLLSVYADKKPRENRIIGFLMFDHIGGLNTLFSTFASGSTLVIPESRDANHICELIEMNKVNVLPTSPTFLSLLLFAESYKAYDLSSLALITYGTEPMPDALLNKLQTAFPKARFLQTFGTSETGIARTVSKSSESTLLKFDDPNTEWKIVNKELWLRSKTQVLGYINSEMTSFSEDGWYKTGDIVEESDAGYIKVIGRLKEVINVGGQKVLPEEVEETLMELPMVADCLVYGDKNIITGQSVVADVVLKSDQPADNIKTKIRELCKIKLDRYKLPVKINLVQQIAFNDRFKRVRVK